MSKKSKKAAKNVKWVMGECGGPKYPFGFPPPNLSTTKKGSQDRATGFAINPDTDNRLEKGLVTINGLTVFAYVNPDDASEFMLTPSALRQIMQVKKPD